MRTLRCCLFALVVSLVVGVAPAFAHARLVGVSPADGSTTNVAPSTVRLRFEESIRAPCVVVVTGPDGTRADRGRTTVTGATAAVPVTVARSGRYTVAYRVLSDDGHPVTGQTTFVYQPPGATTTAGTARPDSGQGPSAAGWVLGGVAVALALATALLVSGRRRQPGASDNGAGSTTQPPPA